MICKSVHKLSYQADVEIPWADSWGLSSISVTNKITKTDKAWIISSVYASCHSRYCEANFYNAMTSTTTYNPFSRNHLLSLYLRTWPHQSLALRILDLYVQLPFRLRFTGYLWNITLHFNCYSHLPYFHQPGIQSERFRAGPAQLFMEIFLLKVSNSHLSTWRYLLINLTFCPKQGCRK